MIHLKTKHVIEFIAALVTIMWAIYQFWWVPGHVKYNGPAVDTVYVQGYKQRMVIIIEGEK